MIYDIGANASNFEKHGKTVSALNCSILFILTYPRCLFEISSKLIVYN